MIVTKPERVSVVLPSINKTYLIKPKDTTYSQANLPDELSISPTISRNEPSEKIRYALSPLDQNQTSENLSYLLYQILFFFQL